MPDWPHAPLHRLGDAGSYMVTAATYHQEPLFNSAAKLEVLQNGLFHAFRDREIPLQAWAIFPNHYDVIVLMKDAKLLSPTVRELHSKTGLAINAIDRSPSRRVWFQYWDSYTKHQRSFLARLHYVHANAVHHGIARRPENYRWCSAGWFERNASAAFRKTVYSYPIDLLKVKDDFTVEPFE